MNILGIGTDIIEIKRFEDKNIEKKFLNNDELEILKKYEGERKLEFIAGRWAGKEAIIKATNKKVKYSELSILINNDGSPKVLLNGIEAKNILLTISHEKKYTVAFSIVVKV